MSGLRIAFKEWAVICEALAGGKQSIILRKGGIAEEGGTFRVEHQRFWLYPTYVHQQATGIITEARPLLERTERERPASGMVRLSHFVDVESVRYLETLEAGLALVGQHIWSEETVRARFAYRRTGLFALHVKTHRAAKTHEFVETAAYAGCRSWVELERGMEIESGA